MESFKKLITIADRLLSKEGCPWDKEQTFLSLQPYLTEEVHEVLEAIDENNDAKIVEELGDLLYTIIFYAKIGEKEGRFSIENILEELCKKIVYRHPHIFGDASASSPEEVEKLYDQVKSKEKDKLHRKNPLDGIPERLPLLPKAQKILHKIRKSKGEEPRTPNAFSDEEIGKELLGVIAKAEKCDIDAESALRRAIKNLEKEFRYNEQT